MKTRQQFVIEEFGVWREEIEGWQWLLYFCLRSIVDLLVSGRQPMINPIATALANTSPQGSSIDFHTKKLMLTKLAFWTDIRAIRTIQIAAMIEMIKFVIAFTISVREVR